MLQRVIKSQRVFMSTVLEHNKGAIQGQFMQKVFQLSDPVPSH